MLIPKRTKFRKMQRGRLRGKACSGNSVSFGTHAIQALEIGFVTERQVEAARRAISRRIKRGGMVWIRVLADKPMTKLPAETRMGKGKGSPEFWVCRIRPGFILFEIGGVDDALAKEALALAQYKLPIRTRVTRSTDGE